MWILTLIAIIASLTGYASMTSQIALEDAEGDARVTTLALDMVSYRSSVVRSVKADPSLSGIVAVNPSFTPIGYVGLTPPQWSNYVVGDTIIVYSVGVSPPGLIKGITTLAQGSVLAGRANTVTNKIEAPGTIGVDQIDLPSIPSPNTITNGAVIWLAYRE